MAVVENKLNFLVTFILILLRCASAISGFSGVMRMRIIWGAKVLKSGVIRMRYNGDSREMRMRMTLSGYGKIISPLSQFSINSFRNSLGKTTGLTCQFISSIFDISSFFLGRF